MSSFRRPAHSSRISCTKPPKNSRLLGQIPSSDSERRVLLLPATYKLREAIAKLFRAEGTDKESNLAPLILKMAERFAADVRNSLPEFYSKDYHIGILNLMKASAGYSLPNLSGDSIFRSEIKRIFFERNMIEKIRIMIDGISNLMKDTIEKELKKISALSLYPYLLETIIEKCHNLVSEEKEQAVNITDFMVHTEQAQLFTVNKEYFSSLNQVERNIHNYRISEFLSEKGEVLVLKNDKYKNVHNLIGSISEEVSDKDLSPLSSVKDYVNFSKNDFLSEGTGDIQLSIKVYSDILMNRLFDVIPMNLKSMLVLDLNSNLQIEISAQFEDIDLAQFL